MTTVCCVWVRANVPYPVTYVSRLRSMVTRHMDRPFTFACVTDRPSQLPAGVKAIEIQDFPKGTSGWWAKIRVFRPHLFTGRVLYLDLDVLVRASLAPILDYPSGFALVPDAGTFQGRNGLKVVKRFNSSVMVWDAGCDLATRVWDTYTPATPMRLWGDQDHIGEQIPEATTMPAEWFPRISDLQGEPPTDPVKVVLVKKPKNEQAAELYPWVREVWQ